MLFLNFCLMALGLCSTVGCTFNKDVVYKDDLIYKTRKMLSNGVFPSSINSNVFLLNRNNRINRADLRCLHSRISYDCKTVYYCVSEYNCVTIFDDYTDCRAKYIHGNGLSNLIDICKSCDDSIVYINLSNVILGEEDMSAILDLCEHSDSSNCRFVFILHGVTYNKIISILGEYTDIVKLDRDFVNRECDIPYKDELSYLLLCEYLVDSDDNYFDCTELKNFVIKLGEVNIGNKHKLLKQQVYVLNKLIEKREGEVYEIYKYLISLDSLK